MGSATGYHPGWVYHGLIVGTTADAARLLWLLTHEALLKPATWSAMKEGRALPEHRSDVHPDPAYGLGLMLTAKAPDAHSMGHGGGGPGSTIAVYAKNGRSAAVWHAVPSTTDSYTRVNEILEAVW
jgi:hypothetical protein